MSDLERACLFVLQNNLALQSGEKVLVVTDKVKKHIGTAFLNAAKKITTLAELTEIPVGEYNGQEPPAATAELMLQADVILMPVKSSLSWTKARMAAAKCGARIVSMGGDLDENLILRLFEIDYHPIKERVNRVCDLLDKANTVHLTTEAGTDIIMGIDGRQGRGRKGGLYTKKGFWGNLPCGEAFIAPIEGASQGVYVVDVSHAGVGKLIQPIRVTVANGIAVNITGGTQAGIVKKQLENIGNPGAFNIAELGIGCNDKVEITGATIADEKVMGTCHIALGSNCYFGGKIDAGIHVDGIINKPSIWLDEKQIMEKGRLLL